MTNTAEQRPEMTMNEVTLAALKASIAHWEKNLAAESPDDVRLGPRYCALCEAFPQSCAGCPVAARTGVKGCRETPYGRACAAFNEWDSAVTNGSPNHAEKATAWRAAAQAEIDFLRSLMPEEAGQ